MTLLNEECIKITDDYDVIGQKYIIPDAVMLAVLWIGLLPFVKLIQMQSPVDVFDLIFLFFALLLLAYAYYITKPIVSCHICKGYLLLKGYGKPIKVDFDNICSIDNAYLVKEPGKYKSLVAVRFWKKTALGQTVKIYVKKENLYKGERLNEEAYLVKLINQYKDQKD